MVASRVSAIQTRFFQMRLLPRLITLTGGVMVLLASVQAVHDLSTGGNLLELFIDFILISTPGVVLLYSGFWIADSAIDSQYYPRLIAWLLGGVAIMFGFIFLRELHPGVTVEWSLGTQAIALAIGSIGGLLIGIQESKATMQTEQLEERKRTLERQNERLDAFTSVVSHDLRNPLNVASGRLELAKDDCESEHLAEVDLALDRMETLIDELLELARQDEAVGEQESIVLAALLENCWTTVETNDATLNIDVERTVTADKSRLQQVFENLFRNAIEHGGEDVTITVGECEDGFYIEDDGPGILEDEREEIFETGYSTSDEGTGFGLSIVKEIVEAQGWEITVTEGSDGGARFEISDVEFV